MAVQDQLIDIAENVRILINDLEQQGLKHNEELRTLMGDAARAGCCQPVLDAFQRDLDAAMKVAHAEAAASGGGGGGKGKGKSKSWGS